MLRDLDAGYDELKDAQGIGAAIENILLTMHAIGLGACWIGKAPNAKIERIVGAKEHGGDGPHSHRPPGRTFQ